MFSSRSSCCCCGFIKCDNWLEIDVIIQCILYYYAHLKFNTFELVVFDSFFEIIEDNLANSPWSLSFESHMLNETRFLEMLATELSAIVSNLITPPREKIFINLNNYTLAAWNNNCLLLEKLETLFKWVFFIEVDKWLAFLATLRAISPTLDNFRCFPFLIRCAVTGAIMSSPNVFNVWLIFDSALIFSTIFVNWNVEWPSPFLRTYLGWKNVLFKNDLPGAKFDQLS